MSKIDELVEVSEERIVRQLPERLEDYTIDDIAAIADGKHPEVCKGYDLVMGNPPYKASVAKEGSKNKAIGTQVYPEFMKIADNLSNAYSCLVTPARWFQNKPQKGFRDHLRNSGMDKQVRSLHYFEDAAEMFKGRAAFAGGVAFTFFDKSYDGDTRFYAEGEYQRTGPLLNSSGLVEMDLRMNNLRNAAWPSGGHSARDACLDWLDGLQNEVIAGGFGGSTDSFLKLTKAKRDAEHAIAVRLPKEGVRYGSLKIFKDCHVPQGKYGIAFTHASHCSREGWNDRQFLLQGFETCKSTMAWVFDTQTETVNFWKYSRTKLFSKLATSRMSDHNTYPQAYQDIPWLDFTAESDVPWHKPIPEIDQYLFEKFQLPEELCEFVLEQEVPFGRVLKEENLNAASRGVEWSGQTLEELNRWY